ncbi:MAG: GTP cyclohydrolase II [Gammaproteobacteria bacterium]
MFTYINPDVRKRLIARGKLVRINSSGEQISATEPPPEGELAINILGPIPLPIKLDNTEMQVEWYATVRSSELAQVESLARSLSDQGRQTAFAELASALAVNSVLMIGDPEKMQSPLVRVHSSCLTGDVFGSQRCECGPQFVSALKKIHDSAQGGMLIYMSGHEGRGIGLWAKAATYLLQDDGEDTYQANESLGLPADSRDFSDAAAMLKYFAADKPIRLLTNNPKKIGDLKDLGIEKISAEKHVIGVGDWNRRYLAAKKDWGHQLDIDDLEK